MIGGADGPTSIFLTGKISGPDMGWVSIGIGTVILVAGIIILRKNHHR